MPIMSKLFGSLITVTAGFATVLLILPVFGSAQNYSSKDYKFTVDTVAKDLVHPWGLAFLPDGTMLVTERDGALQWVKPTGEKMLVDNVPVVVARGQGGLLDVAVDRNYTANQQIYLSYSEPRRNNSTGTSVAKARFVPGLLPRLETVQVIFRQNNPTVSPIHFGSRFVQTPNDKLFFTIGDRRQSNRAQNPFDHAGSVLRINTDGSIPTDNPFADGKKGAKEIWSIGHRNPQGATLHKRTGKVWTVEHGAAGGDEINKPEPGKNYGWPVISYGTHYSGAKIGIGTRKAGMEQPIWFWDPSIAPSGMAYFDGDKFPKWQGNLFVGALRGAMLVRLTLEGEKVVSEERLLEDEFGRIRDVRQGPDGNLYLLIDDTDGQLLRVRPSNP